MRLRTLPAKKNLRGQRVLLRVDWNIPLEGGIEPEASLKVERSLQMLKTLTARGAIVIVLTHLGRPKKREASLSTKRLVPLLKKGYDFDVIFHGESVSDAKGRAKIEKHLASAEAGSMHLLENVRFEAGEEKNLASLAKAYASLGDMFVNDAFASCHRAHVSVVGIAKYLPGFAGLSLEAEAKSLSALLTKPKRPFVAVIGGKKLSTKIPIITTLLKTCDAVMVGGAMAHACLVAKGYSIGASYVETEALSAAKKLLKAKNLFLPSDLIVTHKLKEGSALRHVPIDKLESKDISVDIGYATLKDWGQHIQSAKTILWNGPIGVTEFKEMGAGSRFIARVIGAQAKGRALGIAGGGDTIPVIQSTKTLESFDFVSTGGGAMLEFLTKKGHLPGLTPLLK